MSGPGKRNRTGAAVATESDSGHEQRRPDDAGEPFDLEKYKRDAEAFSRQLIDWVGPDTPEGKKIVRELEAENAPIPRPTRAEAEEIQLIDLRLLDDSPLHHRHWTSPEEQTALRRSIEANGLKNPIVVRPKGDRFEIICGHRRVEAYRDLLAMARTESDSAKYQSIRAIVRTNASDLDALLLGIAEDLQREDFPAIDAARSLQLLQSLRPELSSAQKLSEATGLAVKKVARHLQLCHAAPLVREMMSTGVMVEAKDDEGTVRQEERNLELLAALEFDRLHAALSAREQSSVADRKTREAIECALRENWGYREVKRYVDKAISALEGPKKVRGRPRVPFKWNKRRLVVDVDLLDGLDASQKGELRKVMESIIRRL